ncbi:MAG: hypothetical protein H6996_09465 [Moraxellaceae bacterium]|nr:hypothetical protein [Pseudomonadales bacterium]MCP5175318.1 hypothetical protein [Moraxellaceae bacterium]MCP5177312.1 hypothetical protein [Moraxellaceae bacterium]
MTREEALALMKQIHFFNTQFHACANKPHLKFFRDFMRSNKDRCQLMLLKFASADLVWVKKDLNHPNQEWSIGLHGLPDNLARHIPLSVLQQGLSYELLKTWQIN